MHLKEIKNQNYYLIKTYNGKYYQTYKNKNCVGLYNISIIDDLPKKRKQKEIFLDIMQEGDVILIPSYKNKKISIGIVISSVYKNNNQLYRNVEWENELYYHELDHRFHKYFYRDATIISLTEIAEYIDRLMHSIFIKERLYHIILNVNQESNIQCKSLYGLYHIILDETKIKDLQIKLSLYSPGIIEFISGSLDFIIMMIKIVKIIKLLKKDNKNLEEKQLIKQYEKMISNYYQYEVDKLQLDVTNNDITRWFVTK